MKTKSKKPVTPPLQKYHFWVAHEKNDLTELRKVFKSELEAPLGTILRCYEAFDELDARRQATAWAEEWVASHRARAASNAASLREKRTRLGLCWDCGNKRGKTSRCDECNAKNVVRQRELRAGREPKIKRLPASVRQARARDQAASQREKEIERWGSAGGVLCSRELKIFDEHNPSPACPCCRGYRAYLCNKIRGFGGGSGLDEYERERAKRQGDVPEAAE